MGNRYEETICKLFEDATTLGLDVPSDAMLYELLRSTEFNTLMNPERVAQEHGLIWNKGNIDHVAMEKTDMALEKIEEGEQAERGLVGWICPRCGAAHSPFCDTRNCHIEIKIESFPIGTAS